MNRALVIAALMMLGASSARADLGLTADRPQASLVTWWPTVRGSLGLEVGPAGGSATFSDGARASVGASAAFRTFGAVCLDLDYTPVETDAAVASRAAFTFRDQVFATTGTAHLHYRMPILGLGLRYLVLDGPRGNLGVIGAVKVAEPEVAVTLGSTTASFHMVLPVPLVGVAGEVKIVDGLSAFGSYKMLHLDVSAVNADVRNGEAGLAWTQEVRKKIDARVAAGWRMLNVDLASGGEGDLRFSTRRGGPFVELAVAF